MEHIRVHAMEAIPEGRQTDTCVHEPTGLRLTRRV